MVVPRPCTAPCLLPWGTDSRGWKDSEAGEGQRQGEEALPLGMSLSNYSRQTSQHPVLSRPRSGGSINTALGDGELKWLLRCS